MTDRYAVIGNPVAHSKSPFIHAEFARQTGQDLLYDRILAPLEGFAKAARDFQAQGGKGMNVTVPFKIDAYALAQEHSARAVAAGAVNVLKFDAGTLFGDNSDGIGLVRDIEVNLRQSIEGRDVLLMGAGGAALGAMGPLIDAHPSRLIVANRTVGKAEQLIERFRDTSTGSVALAAFSYADLIGQQFQIVINATAASLNNTVPQLPAGVFARNSLAYDMMYGIRSPFLEFALTQGAGRLADGTGMLVEQAAESFFIWRGVRPDTRPVIDALAARAA